MLLITNFSLPNLFWSDEWQFQVSFSSLMKYGFLVRWPSYNYCGMDEKYAPIDIWMKNCFFFLLQHMQTYRLDLENYLSDAIHKFFSILNSQTLILNIRKFSRYSFSDLDTQYSLLYVIYSLLEALHYMLYVVFFLLDAQRNA